MDRPYVKVLLLGQNESGSSYLRWQLENRGCHCWFAHSAQEGAALYKGQTFDMILSTAPLPKLDAELAGIASNACIMFHCRPEEDSCWWQPVAREGQKKAAAPGMRPSEFLEMLDKMLSKRRPMSLPPQRLPAPEALRAMRAAS